MHPEDNARKIICDSIDSLTDILETLPVSVTDASQLMVNCLLNDGKVIVCANGSSAPLASFITTSLMNRHEHERPGLPAINLSSNISTITAITRDSNYNDIFSKQIRAIGHTKDILIVLTEDGNCANVIQAIQAAHDKEMKIVALTGKDGGHLSSLLHPEDIEIRVTSNSGARIQEGHLLAINTTCSLIDQQIFGVG
ncbi:SIS domain-containing protein [Alkalimarinus coralli]|uniref:SIS domain-containing protein n=1 Tax=Alkalimarinus coralli TaxID=2935863 RepID=UPI00202B2A8C|nr:SIS domain-containing protein [Alkalimarinus coralli]